MNDNVRELIEKELTKPRDFNMRMSIREMELLRMIIERAPNIHSENADAYEKAFKARLHDALEKSLQTYGYELNEIIRGQS